MNEVARSDAHGFTIIELMVTIVIVSVLAATAGTFFMKLLTLQEKERESAYIRERLVDICEICADALSIGTSISNIVDSVNPGFEATYRYETGGVSLEAGRVSRVAKMQVRMKTSQTLNNKACTTLDLGVKAVESGRENLMFSRNLRADNTPLIPFPHFKVKDNLVKLSYTMTPLNENAANAALWNLNVIAQYEVKNRMGEFVLTNVVAERVVRLWNHE